MFLSDLGNVGCLRLGKHVFNMCFQLKFCLNFLDIDPKKPMIWSFPSPVFASEGISVILKCKTKGSPRPKIIIWYKDDQLLGICEGVRSRKYWSFTKLRTEFKKNPMTLYQLSFKRNNGKYTCEVEYLWEKPSRLQNCF